MTTTTSAGTLVSAKRRVGHQRAIPVKGFGLRIKRPWVDKRDRTGGQDAVHRDSFEHIAPGLTEFLVHHLTIAEKDAFARPHFGGGNEQRLFAVCQPCFIEAKAGKEGFAKRPRVEQIDPVPNQALRNPAREQG
jgi:hypothetical protein